MPSPRIVDTKRSIQVTGFVASDRQGLRLDAGLRLDLLVADSIIVELKSVQRMESVFEAQLLSYLKLTGLRLGLLINFNVPLIKHGISRVVL